MTEQFPSSPELEFVPLSPEQAELLANDPEAVRDLGHVAMAGVEMIGIVPATEDAPAYFVNLNESDPGTRINVSEATEKTRENRERYGSPDVVAEQFYGEPEAVTEQQEGAALAEAAEEAGLTDVLRRYDDLEDMIRDSDRINSMSIDDLRQDVINLQAALDMAADSGPWSGNYLQNHPELMSQLDVKLQGMAEQATEIERRVTAQQEETSRYTQSVNGRAAEIGKLSDVNEQASFDAELQQVQDSLQQMAKSGELEGVSTMRYALNVLSEARANPNLTVSDVRDMTSTVMTMLDTAEQQLKGGPSAEMASERISALRKLVQEKQ